MKTRNTVLYIVWAAYALLMGYNVWNSWPHSMAWLVALFWFAMYVVAIQTARRAISLAREVIDILRAAREKHE